MTKLLLFVAVVTSCVFLLTQFLTIFYFNNNNNNKKKKENLIRDDQQQQQQQQHTTVLLHNVRLFLQKCDLAKIPCILVHKDILTNFLLLEKKHRRSSFHDHRRCKHLCGGRRHVTFLAKSTDFVGRNKEFVGYLSKDFHLFEDWNFDPREASVERPRGGKLKILNHLYLHRNGTFIHVVVSYPRLEREWTHTCNLGLVNNLLFKSELGSSMYCKQQQLWDTFDSTRAVVDGIKMRVPKYLATFLRDIDKRKFVPCHFENVRRFLSSYGLDSSAESNIFRTKASNLLSIASDVLNELKVPFWLSSGTCLGWFRQCDFIPHSKDVDIGIWIKDYKEGIIRTFKERGLSLKHVFGKIEDSFELSFKLDDMKLDIFFFYEDDRHMWNGGTQARTGKKFKYFFEKFELCWTSIHKLTVRVPCPTDRYIRANYGDSWHVVVKTWDWKASPPNVRENGEWPEEERKDVIKVFSV